MFITDNAEHLLESEVLHESVINLLQEKVSSDVEAKLRGTVTFSNVESVAKKQMAEFENFLKTGDNDKLADAIRRGELGETSISDAIKALPKDVRNKIKLSEKEMTPLFHKIVIRVIKNPFNILSIIKEEVMLNIAFIDGDKSAGAIVLLIMATIINTFAMSLFLKIGGTAAKATAITAILIAPITEELSREFQKGGEKEFTTAINISEFIQYVSAGLRDSSGLVIAAMRLTTSQPLHAANAQRLTNAEKNNTSRTTALLKNIGQHAVFNLLALLLPLGFVIFALVTAQKSVSTNFDKFDV